MYYDKKRSANYIKTSIIAVPKSVLRASSPQWYLIILPGLTKIGPVNSEKSPQKDARTAGWTAFILRALFG